MRIFLHGKQMKRIISVFTLLLILAGTIFASDPVDILPLFLNTALFDFTRKVVFLP